MDPETAHEIYGQQRQVLYCELDHCLTELDMKRLHAARLEIVRDADISLLEMTSAALDWYRRPSRVGQNGVFLEARGLVKAADAQAEGSRKTDKGEPAREVRLRCCEIEGIDAKGTEQATLTSQGADNLGGSAPQERDSPGPSDSDFDEIDFLSPRRHHKDEPVRLPVSEPGGAKAAGAQWQPTARRQLRSYKERKPAIIKHVSESRLETPKRTGAHILILVACISFVWC